MSLMVQILIGVGVVLVLVAAFIALKPSSFRVSRSKSMTAPPSAIFALVNDHHNWADWSPWEKFDSAMAKTFEGPTSGTGAVYRWSGNNQVGEGVHTIVESRPYELIRTKLEFMRPFKATNAVEFSFLPQGDQTVMTWTMTGNHNFMAKAMGLFMNMEKMIGNSFDEGLTRLKGLVEARR